MLIFRSFIFVLLIVLVSNCGSTNKEQKTHEYGEYNFSEIESLLLGETLNQPYLHKSSHKTYKKYSFKNIYVGSGNKPNEANIIIKPDSMKVCYEALLNLYNTNFSSAQTGDRFNSWSTDSLEIILFKQTDSSILVNIFTKTYK